MTFRLKMRSVTNLKNKINSRGEKMKKYKLNRHEEAMAARYKELNDFIMGDFFSVHEYPFDDPAWEKMVCRLYELTNRLYAATFI
jgi:hypothetical protein